MGIKIMIGDVRERLKELPDESVHCVVTSPPYYGLRDYGVDGQIGLEETPAEYVETLVSVFREVRRVLRKDGTVWLNLGDSYHNADKWGGGGANTGKHTRTPDGDVASWQAVRRRWAKLPDVKPKDLLMIPAQVALALRGDGWYLRSEIVWAKPNPMPESVTDRPTSAHEKVFLLSKANRYFYDAEAVREADLGTDHVRTVLHKPEPSGGVLPPHQGIRKAEGRNGSGRNLRNVWTIATAPFPEAHFATFPPALVEPCIKAGTSEKGCCPECGAPWVRETTTDYVKNRPSAGNDPRSRSEDKQAMGSLGGHHGWRGNNLLADVKTTGWAPSCACRCYAAGGDGQPHAPRRCTVLDPFAGAGTVGLVADRLGRDAILVELKPEYAAMAQARLAKDAGLFGAVETV